LTGIEDGDGGITSLAEAMLMKARAKKEDVS
jgi:hypothetical protein